MTRAFLFVIAIAAVAATKPATKPSAKPQAESKGAPNPAAVVTDASTERGPATTTKSIAPTKTSATTTTSTQPESKPVPLLSAEDAARTFNLPPGFRAEVVAAEPLVQQPVAMEFDPDGRIWVVEMRGYM